MSLNKFIISLIICLFVSVVDSASQCCSAGNPADTDVLLDSGNKGQLELSLNKIHSFSDIYMEGTSVSDYKYIDNSFLNFYSVSINYGITNSLKLYLDVGYFSDKYQEFDFGTENNLDRNAFGLGDMNIGLSYNLLLSEDNSLILSPIVRATLPIGVFDQKVNNVVLPIDIQPSSGNFKYAAGMSLSHSLFNNNLILIGNYVFEYSQKIETERTIYKYGDFHNASISVFYPYSDQISWVLQTNYQFREKATNKIDNLVESTGGHVIYISPQVNLEAFGFGMISLKYMHPVYKNMNGVQLTNNYMYSISFAKNFDLISLFSRVDETKTISDSRYSEIEVKVRGECGMCKDRIESVTNEFRNVMHSNWNYDSQTLVITYSENIPDIDKIEQALATVGHDTDNHLSDNKTYESLPGCCHYRTE